MEWRNSSSPRPRKFRVQKSAGQVFASIFWDQDGILLIDFLARGHTVNTEYYWFLLVQLKDIFKERKPREGQQWGLVLARQCPGSPGTCNPEETGLPGLPVSWSPTLFSGSGHVGLPPVPWTEKIWKFTIFCPTRRSLLRGDLVGRTNFWTFLNGLQIVRATG